MEKQNKKEHPRLNKSRISRYITVLIFLIFAGIAFYVTIDKPYSKPAIDETDPTHQTQEVLAPANSAKEETEPKPSYHYEDLELWDKIVVNYFAGNDVYNDLSKFYAITKQDTAINTKTLKLKNLVASVKTYKPVVIYLDIKAKLEKVENQHQQVEYNGELGKFLKRFMKVRDKSTNFAMSERIDNIMFHLKEQNYKSAESSLQDMQKECVCLKIQDFVSIKNQKEIFELLEQITKNIHPEKK